MTVREAGSDTAVNDEQYENAKLPIEATESGKVTDSNEVQSKKAWLSIDVTESGRVSAVKAEQP